MKISREGLKFVATFLLGALVASGVLMPFILRPSGIVYSDKLISLEVTDPVDLREQFRAAVEFAEADVNVEEQETVIYTLGTSDELTPGRRLSVAMLLTLQPDGTLKDASVVFEEGGQFQYAGLTAPRTLDIPTTTGAWHAWDEDGDWKYESIIGQGPVVDGRTQHLFIVEGAWRPGFRISRTEVEVDGQRHKLRGGYWLPE